MTKAQELLGKIKLLFSEVAPPAIPAAVIAPQLMSGKLADGTEITFDKMEVGGVATVGGVTVSAGEYTLDDGTMFTADEAGIITSVTPVQEMAKPPVVQKVDTPPAVVEAEAAPPAVDLSAIESRLSALEDMCKSLMEKETAQSQDVATQMDVQKQAMKSVIELVEELAGEAPEAPAAAQKKFSFITNDKNTGKMDRIERFRAAAQRLRESKIA